MACCPRCDTVQGNGSVDRLLTGLHTRVALRVRVPPARLAFRPLDGRPLRPVMGADWLKQVVPAHWRLEPGRAGDDKPPRDRLMRAAGQGPRAGRPAIGPHGRLTVQQAREIARNWLREVAAGGDPSQDRYRRARRRHGRALPPLPPRACVPAQQSGHGLQLPSYDRALRLSNWAAPWQRSPAATSNSCTSSCGHALSSQPR